MYKSCLLVDPRLTMRTDKTCTSGSGTVWSPLDFIIALLSVFPSETQSYSLQVFLIASNSFNQPM